MFNKKDYQAAFDQVRASEDTYQEVMCMTNRRKNKKASGGRRVVVLIAAVIALTAMVTTAFASEIVSGWICQYFENKDANGLSQKQVEYVEEKEQVMDALSQKQMEYTEEQEQVTADAKVQNGWSVELRSVLSDGDICYVILGVRAPEEISLTETDLYFGAGFDIRDEQGQPPLSHSFQQQDDQDGLDNTCNIVIVLGAADWNAGHIWNIQLDGLYAEVYDEAYEQELLQTKYAGQADVMFTGEETERLLQHPLLTEGTWSFVVDLRTADMECVELVSQPIVVSAYVWDEGDREDIADGKEVLADVTITSFRLKSLGGTIESDEECVNFGEMYVVMKDESRIVLRESYGTIKAETPIILEEVDYVLFADGTKLPMPESETE